MNKAREKSGIHSGAKVSSRPRPGASALLNYVPRNPLAHFLMIPPLNAREQVYIDTQ